MRVSSPEFRRFRRILIGVFIFTVVLILVTGDWKNAFLFFPSLILIYGPIYFIPFVLIPWITKQITRKMVRTSHSTSPIETINIKKNDYRTNIGKVMALISIILLAAIAAFLVFPGKLGITLSSVLSIVWLIAFIVAITAFNTAKTEKTKLVAEKEGMTFKENGDYLFPLLEEFRLLSFGKKSLKNFSNVSQKKINDIEVTIFDYQYGWYTQGKTYEDRHYDIREQTVIFFQSEKSNIPDFFLCPKKISYKISRKSGFKKINLDTAPLFSEFYLLFGKDEEAIRRVFKKELLNFYEDHRGLTSEGSKNKLICYRPDEPVKPEVFPSFLEEGSRLFEILTMIDAAGNVGEGIDKNILQAKLKEIKGKSRDFRSRLEALKVKGLDIAYPLVSLTILEQFPGFVEDDLVNGKIIRANNQLEELSGLMSKCDIELTSLEQGQLHPRVPRFITSPIRIENGGFKAGVQWSDGSQTDDWPVIFSGYAGWQTLENDIEKMPGYGMNIIPIETGPAFILASEVEINFSEINRLESLLQRAASANVAVTLLLSPDYFPVWAFERWADIQIEAGKYINFSVDSSHVRQVLEDYLRILIPEIAEHPALYSICLTNEPTYFNASQDPENRTAYNNWLKQKYGDIGTLCHAHGDAYASFDDVPVFYWKDGIVYPGEETNPGARYDYFRFNDERFSAWHRWMADIIHEYAPDLPVYVRVSDAAYQIPFNGVDPELFDEFSQIAGNNSSKLYTANMEDYGFANHWQPQNIFFDLLRSMSDKPLFNSENHVIRDKEIKEVPPGHLRNALWQAAIHGGSASLMWVWERDLQDAETGESMPGFTSILHSPAAVNEYGRTALDILRLGDKIQAFRTVSSRVAIIYSSTSLIYNPDHKVYLDAVYEVLNFCGERIDFITEKRLAQNHGDKYEMIFVPGVSHITGDAMKGLEKFVMKGGQVVMVGECNLEYDSMNRPLNIAIPDHVQIPFVLEPELRDHIFPLLENLQEGRPVKIIYADSSSGKAWGVEWLYADLEDQFLLNLVNYNKHSIRIRLQGVPQGKRTDLISMKTVGEVIDMRPLSIYFITISK